MTTEQIIKIAKASAYYVDPDGQWLRIQNVDTEDGVIHCYDEDNYDDYVVDVTDITESEPHFEMFVKIRIGEPNKKVFILELAFADPYDDDGKLADRILQALRHCSQNSSGGLVGDDSETYTIKISIRDNNHEAVWDLPQH